MGWLGLQVCNGDEVTFVCLTLQFPAIAISLPLVNPFASKGSIPGSTGHFGIFGANRTFQPPWLMGWGGWRGKWPPPSRSNELPPSLPLSELWCHHLRCSSRDALQLQIAQLFHLKRTIKRLYRKNFSVSPKSRKSEILRFRTRKRNCEPMGRGHLQLLYHMGFSLKVRTLYEVVW